MKAQIKSRKYLGRIDDAGVDHVDENAVEGVVAEVAIVGLHDLVDNNGRVDAGVLGDLHHRLLQRMPDDLDAFPLVIVGGRDAVEDVDAAEESGAAAGHDAFFDGGPGGVQCVGDTVLLLAHLNFGSAANLKYRSIIFQVLQTDDSDNFRVPYKTCDRKLPNLEFFGNRGV